MAEAYYRLFESSIDSNGEVVIHVEAFEVLRHTPKGVWLKVPGKPKFVLHTERKQWAWPTIEQARQHFFIRKNWQLRHLRAKINQIEAAIVTAKHNEYKAQHTGDNLLIAITAYGTAIAGTFWPKAFSATDFF